MKTVDNDELSNLVLKGELTQEEALSMTDDKEQLLRLIKNKRWTHYYLRALIYQKHALNLLIENRAYWDGIKKKIKDITNTRNSLQALMDDYQKDYERIAEKQTSYNRLKGMAKGKTLDAMARSEAETGRWYNEEVSRWNRVIDNFEAQASALDLPKMSIQKKINEVRNLEMTIDRDNLTSAATGARLQQEFRRKNHEYTTAQKLSGYAAIASSLDDLFQMMADAMLA